MKLTKCEVRNFGSYKHFEIDFSSPGLNLIYGRTGSGKSTIPDMPAWILYGQTAKDGASDDVRSWQAPNEATVGVLIVEISNGPIIVTRTRGKNKNDLSWNEPGSDEPHRGKDLTETQKLLEQRLGVSSETYFSGAYFHEFSASGNFFLAKAKERRSLFESITDLSFPVALAEKTVEERKGLKAKISTRQEEVARLDGQLKELAAAEVRLLRLSQEWQTFHTEKLRNLEKESRDWGDRYEMRATELSKKISDWDKEATKRRNLLEQSLQRVEASLLNLPGDFEEDRRVLQGHIEELHLEKCSKCGASTRDGRLQLALKAMASLDLEEQLYRHNKAKHQELKAALRAENEAENPYKDSLQDEENPYTALMGQELSQDNSYEKQAAITHSHLISARASQDDFLSALDGYAKRLHALSTIYDLSNGLRGQLLTHAVKEIETVTNNVLDDYFDSELRVTFTLEGADSLKVEIAKSGYDCSYKQLSKGQRQLLKLSFSKALMEAVANKSGVHFNTLFFDEALDGLDGALKVKAFALFQKLSLFHPAVYLIEHSEDFQNLFTNKLKVDLVGDHSEVTDGSI